MVTTTFGAHPNNIGENTHAIDHLRVFVLAMRLVSKRSEVCNQRMACSCDVAVDGGVDLCCCCDCLGATKMS